MKIPTYIQEYCDWRKCKLILCKTREEENKRRKQGEKQNKKFNLMKIK